jgi:hypothetical protein
VDPNKGNIAQAAVHDLEDVFRWIKDPGSHGWAAVGPSHYARWDGENIMMLGASAGGNLVASMAAAASSSSDFRPQASALLSGFPETDVTSDSTYPCDSGSTHPTTCWTHVNNYLDCLDGGIAPDGPVTTCEGTDGAYQTASPTHGYAGGPTQHGAMFIANAGGDGNADLSPLVLAQDFDAALQGDLYNEGTTVKLCIVDITGHATGYLDNTNYCDDESASIEVIESIDAFYAANLAS